MYRCSICGATSRPRDPLIRLVRHKPGTKLIASERPVCRACAKQVESGLTEADIRRSLAPAPETPVATAPTSARVEI